MKHKYMNPTHKPGTKNSRPSAKNRPAKVVTHRHALDKIRKMLRKLYNPPCSMCQGELAIIPWTQVRDSWGENEDRRQYIFACDDITCSRHRTPVKMLEGPDYIAPELELSEVLDEKFLEGLPEPG